MMRRSMMFVTIGLASVLVLAACGGDDDPTLGGTPDAGTETAEAVTEPAAEPTATGAAASLDLSLTGAAVPDGGSEDGSGEATLELDPAAGEVCFEVSVEDVEPVTAMHIHEGAEGESGPVFIGLSEAFDGDSIDDCAEAEASDIQQVVDNPSDYYLNLHNEDFPAGVLRAQLG